jgi:surface protein
MRYTFLNCFSFQGLGLDVWDTSNVQSMEAMFLNTPNFNGDLSLWNVSRVTSMRKQFRQATSFNSDLSRWDVSRVTDMTETVSICYTLLLLVLLL